MLNLSYSISPALQDRLHSIEIIRRQILLTPLPPSIELRLRWEAKINRLYWATAFSQEPPPRADLIKLVTREKPKPQTQQEKEVVSFQKAFDWIAYNWCVSAIPVTLRAVAELAGFLASKPELKSTAQEQLKQALDWLQASPENPVVQAAVAQVQFLQVRPLVVDNEVLANLIPYLFLYKHGYDCRGLLVLEEYFRRDLAGFKQTLAYAAANNNLTGWLEYFATAMLTQLEKEAAHIASPAAQAIMPDSFWKMSDRQKGILALLEAPGSTITNRRVQKLFHVSQITASRDLAKLTNLGLLFPHGKGRSVYYTKV